MYFTIDRLTFNEYRIADIHFPVNCNNKYVSVLIKMIINNSNSNTIDWNFMAAEYKYSIFNITIMYITTV